MSTSCVTTPTQTRTDQVTTQSLQTTFTNSVSTAPPTTTVTVIHTCIGGNVSATGVSGAIGACSTVDSTVPITIPGFTSTIAVPVTLTVDVTAAQVTTLFGTSCTTITVPNNPQNPPSSSSTTPISTPTPPPPSSETSTFISSSATTLANGIVTTQEVTVTSTLPATGTTAGVTGGAQQTQNQNENNSSSSSPKLGPIIGGVVGGFFGLLAIVFTIWFIIKRRRRWDDIFDKEEDEFIAAGVARHKGKPDLTAEPKPYEYGLVGHGSAPIATSPPNSPTLLATPLSSESMHGRNRSSLTPLMATGMVGGPPQGSNHSGLTTRPSTAGSTQPLVSSSSYFPSTGSAHAHSQSTVSMSDPPLAHVPQQHWGGQAQNFVPAGAAAPVAVGGGGGMEEPAYLHRSGSPVSIQEQRILQVTNALPGSPVGNAFAEGSSSSVAAAAAAAGSSSSQPQRDGKGRLINTKGEKVPLVHLDGGRFQQGASSSEPAPPSYDD